MRGRRERKPKRLINYLIIGITLSIMTVLGIGEYKDNKIKREEDNKNLSYTAQDMSISYKKDEQKKKETKEYPKEKIPEEYKGYKIAAKLEIPKI